MKKSSTKTEKILFWVTKKQKTFLEVSAENLDMSMSAYLRYLINQQIKKFPMLKDSAFQKDQEEINQTSEKPDEDISDAELDELFDEIYQKPNQ